METGFSILMLIFGGAIMLYALLVGLGNFDLIPRNHAAKVTNKTAYAHVFGKILAILALSPIAAGIFGLKYGNTAAVIALIISLILAIVICWLLFHPRKDDPNE